MPDRQETLVVAVLPALLALALGAYLLLECDRVDWEAVAAATHALDVAHPTAAGAVSRSGRAGPDLGLIGFVHPPLPTLCLVPFAVLSPLLTRLGIAAVIVSAIFFGLTCAQINRLGAEHGLRPLARWPLVGLFALHPLPLTWAATGSALTLLALLLVGALGSLLRWTKTDGLRHLLAASLYLTAAVVTRYEAVWAVVAMVVLIVVLDRSRPGDEPARLEGTILAFLVPVGYVAGLWVLFNHLIVGDALHFWRESFALPAGELRGALPAHAAERAAEALGLSVMLACPALVALLIGAVAAMDRGRPTPALASVAFLAAIVSYAFASPYVFLSAAVDAGDSRVVPWVGALGLALLFALGPAVLGALSARPAPGGRLIAGLTWAALILPLTSVLPGAASFPGRLPLLVMGQAPLTGDRAPELDAANAADGLPTGAPVLAAGSKAFAVDLWSARRVQPVPRHESGRWRIESPPAAKAPWYILYDDREIGRDDLLIPDEPPVELQVVGERGDGWVMLRATPASP